MSLQPLRVLAFGLAFPLCLGPTLGAAHARDHRQTAQGLPWLADASVRAMATSPTADGGMLRVIALIGDQGADLVLETFAPSDLRNPFFQAHVTTLWVQGQAWNLTQSTTLFDSIGFARDGGVDFALRGPAGQFTCHQNLPAEGTALGAVCDLQGAPQPAPQPAPLPVPTPVPWPTPQPEPVRPGPGPGWNQGGGHHHGHGHGQDRPVVNWAAQPEVIRACGDAFFGQASESACLDAAVTFRIDPTRIIQTCDQITMGDENALRCLRATANVWVDPVAGMLACDQATMGDDNFLRCAQSIAGFSYPQAAVVAACDQATMGDEHALTCIDIARVARGDVSSLIKTCDDAMMGDDAMLACLQRGIQR